MGRRVVAGRWKMCYFVVAKLFSMNITLAQAEAVIAAAKEKAKQLQTLMNIAVISSILTEG